MATLINSPSGTGGESSRLLKVRQHEIIEAWLEHAAAMPPHLAIGPPDMINEIATILPPYLSATLDRAELGGCEGDADALRPVSERAVAAGIPVGNLERALSLLGSIAGDFLGEALADAPEALEQDLRLINGAFDLARCQVAQLYLDAILGKLRDVEDKYLSFMKNVSEALFVCAAQDGAILEANRKAEEFTGHKTGALVGLRLADLGSGRQAERLLDACRRAAADRHAILLENTILTRKDGLPVTADVRISPFHNEGGPRPAVMVSMRDTTSEKELEERMQSFSEQLNRTANEKAEEIAAITRLTSAISSGADLEKIFQVVVFEIGKLVTFDRLSIMLVEEGGRHYRVVASAGKGGQHLARGSVLPVKDSLIERAASERKPIVQHDLSANACYDEDKLLLKEGLASYVYAPLMTGDKLVGALLLCSVRPKAFGRREITIMQDIGEQVAVAMRWARLHEQERRRKAEMKIINEVGREAMSTLDLKALLKAACTSIQQNFTFYDVSIFLADRNTREMKLAARAGGAAGRLSASPSAPTAASAANTRDRRSNAGQKVENGGLRKDDGPGRLTIDGNSIIGRALQSGEVVLVNDISQEPEEAALLPWQLSEGSRLCVPIKTAERVDGALYIQCEELNAFLDTSVSALGTLADLVARAIENARLYQRASSLRNLNENIIATMPSALLVLDQELKVLRANAAYCELANVHKKDLEGKNVGELWGKNFLKESRLLDSLNETLRTGKGRELKNIRHYWSGRHVVLNFGMNCITAGEQPRLLLIMEDVSETVERAFRLSMLREINETIQSTLELDKILRLVLTCVTAGNALGFNRGFLLMVNKGKNSVEGTTGIGPVSLQDARNIYSDQALRTRSLRQFVAECDFSVPREELPLYDLARKMVFSLDEDEIVVKTVKEKKAFLVHDAHNDERVSARFITMIGSNSFVSVPLVAKDEVIGVIVADNLYSGHPITSERAELLALFANHAGLVIENGESYARLQEEIKERIEAYQRLEEMKEREVRTGQLAAIGEMAARVAHEIRNPLVNIGLLARQIVKSLSPEDSRYQNAGTIVGEVMRLERILTDVVDFSKPATPNKLPIDLDAIVDQVTDFVKPQLSERHIQLERLQEGPLPQIAADPAQIKQALLNIVKNAMEAVNRDGRITIATRADADMVTVDVIDTGPGIMDYVVENMYNLFYTTKQGGSGLGLAITRKIIEDHRGLLSVKSLPGEGTSFSVRLPVRAEIEDIPPEQAPIQGGPQA